MLVNSSGRRIWLGKDVVGYSELILSGRRGYEVITTSFSWSWLTRMMHDLSLNRFSDLFRNLFYINGKEV